MTTDMKLVAHHIDEFGFAVKGWNLDLTEVAKAGCVAFDGTDECGEHSSGVCEFPTYGIAEVWIRRRPGLPSEEYSQIFDTAKPNTRGAGRFTVFYYESNPYEIYRQIQRSRWQG